MPIRKPGQRTEFTDEMMEHFSKCSKSVEYFAENFFHIIHHQTGPQLFKLRSYQASIVNSYQNNPLNILVSARQIGKTSMAVLYMLWYALFNRDKTIVILANNLNTAKYILDEIKYAYELLPDWLQLGVTTYNSREIVFENYCRIVAMAFTPDALRGMATSLMYLDEFAFSNKTEEFWERIQPYLNHGERCIITSTPNGKDNTFYKLWVDAVNGSNKFTPLRVDWNEVPGRDEKWKENTIRDIGQRKFNQEFGCQFDDGVVDAN